MKSATTTTEVCVVARAVGTMKLVKWEFLLCKWSSFGFSASLFRLH